jgi:3-oxoacyl-[acyl-carrier-protein] synthase-3
MIYSNSRLHSLCHVVPELSLSTDDLEKQLSPLYDRVGLRAGRLRLMTGIEQRHLWPEGVLASDASAKAGLACLEKSGWDKNDIDLLIHCSVSRDFMEPATASIVHGKMGLGPKTQVYDLSNACLGFLNACSLASGLLEAGQIRSALIVSGENARPLIEGTVATLLKPDQTRKSIKPHFASLTIGCGAAAALLTSPKDAPKGASFLSGVCRADSSGSQLCEGDSKQQELLMETDSEQLLLQGTALAQATFAAFLKEQRWQADSPDHIITHQVGAAHRRLLYETLGLEPHKDHSSFEQWGNVGSASLPITLSLAQQEGRLEAGQHIALLGIGSGINCMMMALRWGN